MTEQVLRPCPFCGHEAKMEFREMDDPNDPNDASVTCSNFECEFGGWWVRPSVWNKRPVEDALQARAERAEATIADCFAMFNEVNLLDGETDLRDVVNDVIDLFLFWKTACEMQNQAVELLDGWVERFIEFGTPLADIARAVNYGNEIELLAEHINNWDKLVTEWKERKDETD